MRPNVLYELGLAHGQSKPTILMNQQGKLGTDAEMMPFDLALQQRLEYRTVDGALPKRLQKAIRAIGPGRVIYTTKQTLLNGLELAVVKPALQKRAELTNTKAEELKTKSIEALMNELKLAGGRRDHPTS